LDDILTFDGFLARSSIFSSEDGSRQRSIVEGFGCAKSGHTHRRERGYELVLASSCCFHSEGDRPAMLAKNRVKALTSE
jgi:hypothetical protein